MNVSQVTKNYGQYFGWNTDVLKQSNNYKPFQYFYFGFSFEIFITSELI